MTLEQWLRIQLNRGFDRFEVDVTDGEHGSLHLNFQPLDSLGDMAGFERAFLCFGDFISQARERAPDCTCAGPAGVPHQPDCAFWNWYLNQEPTDDHI